MPLQGRRSSTAFSRYRWWARVALWTAVGAVLAAVETWLPSPLPWMRLGLANAAGLLALLSLGVSAAFLVTLLRVVVVASLFGSIGTPAFLLSLSGGVIAVSTMGLLALLPFRWIGPIGLSISGAWMHMATQFLLATLMVVRDISLLTLAGPSLLAAVASGAVIGWIVTLLWRKLPSRLVY